MGRARAELREATGNILLDLLVALPLAAAFALVLFVAGFYAMLVGWWGFGIIVPLGGLLLSALWFRRARSSTMRAAMVVTALLSIAWGAALTPIWVDVFRHDRIMGRFEAEVCTHPTAPEGSEVVSCSGLGIANPSNGNQCGYTVRLWMRTDLSAEELSNYYGRVRLSTVFDDLGFFVDQYPLAGFEEPGLAHVDYMAIGDEGNDLRCT